MAQFVSGEQSVKLLTQLESAFKNWQNHKLCLYIDRADAVELLKHHGISLETQEARQPQEPANKATT